MVTLVHSSSIFSCSIVIVKTVQLRINIKQMHKHAKLGEKNVFVVHAHTNFQGDEQITPKCST